MKMNEEDPPFARGGGLASLKGVIPGLVEIERSVYLDPRGTFSRFFDYEAMMPFGWPSSTYQVNFSTTASKGTVRGIHAQFGATPEYKVVTCVQGEVWDVCVDLRKSSETFLRWQAFRLSNTNALSILIPPGVAHGFQTLTDDVAMLYCHSAPYEKDHETGLNPFDPALSIPWPVPVTVVSDRDREHSPLQPNFEGWGQ